VLLFGYPVVEYIIYILEQDLLCDKNALVILKMVFWQVRIGTGNHMAMSEVRDTFHACSSKSE
jgi:hypothetical protein